MHSLPTFLFLLLFFLKIHIYHLSWAQTLILFLPLLHWLHSTNFCFISLELCKLKQEQTQALCWAGIFLSSFLLLLFKFDVPADLKQLAFFISEVA